MPDKVTTPCDQCSLHILMEKKVEDLEKKYGMACDRLVVCENSTHHLDMLKQDQNYLKGSVDEIKMLHRQAIADMGASLAKAIAQVKDETIKPQSDRINKLEKIIYAMFFLLIGIAAKAFLGGA